jgi:hypothetical protein
MDGTVLLAISFGSTRRLILLRVQALSFHGHGNGKRRQNRFKLREQLNYRWIDMLIINNHRSTYVKICNGRVVTLTENRTHLESETI